MNNAKIKFDNYVLSGIMFHYFHDFIEFQETQGSISQDQLEKIIKQVKKETQILSPLEYLENLKNKKPEKATCITFDDGLKCQYKVAIPVLETFNIQAFFFCYSAVWDDKFKTPLLEFFRDYRNNYKGGIKSYYKNFFSKVNSFLKARIENIMIPKDFLIDCPFYTYEDKKYRYLRDEVLKRNEYEILVKDMLVEDNYPFEQKKKSLFMNLDEILELDLKGHEIGLHSSTHPTDLKGLSPENIHKEYFSNYEFLKQKLKKNPKSISYPCGLFNKETEKIMSQLNIEVGFAASLTQYDFNSFNKLLIPREDSTNLLFD
tara:strand:+ start:25991 stop:26941 length:951 start_codon:yes stop_codon:yes gene_type:complete